MAKSKTFQDLEEAISFFPKGSAKMVERLVKRAMDRDAKAAGRNIGKAMHSAGKGSRAGGALGKIIGQQLARAMAQRGAGRKEAASIRQTAPDTGGKPFHFAHTVINKADVPAAAARATAPATSKAAAHMRYIEREIAVEKVLGQTREAEGPQESRTVAAGRGRDDGSWDREIAPGTSTEASVGGPASAAQGYIENPVKLANGENVIFSFGTIGERFDERVAFWEALEKAETRPNGRVQHRLIVELPHEASPAARHEMVQRFCDKFREDGVPFWAALHAPGSKNDSRNFHAHIVYSERPASRMLDPNDGTTKWDFEVPTHWVDKQRHKKTSYRHKQEKLRSYHDMRFIPELRKAFATTVTAILDRDQVKDAKGKPVRYDARSYKDMGVDTVPMRSINRIVADKLKEGRLTVLDGDYTRKMIEAELRDAAARREPKIIELLKLEATLEAIARTPARAASHNRSLPKGMRIGPGATISGAAVKAAAGKLLEARRAALRVDVVERATVETLRGVLSATDPKVLANSLKNTKDPVKRAALPDPVAAAALNAAAREMMMEAEAEAAEARKKLSYCIGAAMDGWRQVVDPAAEGPSLAMRLAMEQETERSSAQSRQRAATPQEPGHVDAQQREAGRPIARDWAQRSDTPAPQPEGAVGSGKEHPGMIRIAGMKAMQHALTDALAEEMARRGKGIRPERMPEGPTMPQMPAMPSLGKLKMISQVLSGIVNTIRDRYDTAEERMTAIESLNPAGAVHRAERLAREAAEAARETGSITRAQGSTAADEPRPQLKLDAFMPDNEEKKQATPTIAIAPSGDDRATMDRPLETAEQAKKRKAKERRMRVRKALLAKRDRGR